MWNLCAGPPAVAVQALPDSSTDNPIASDRDFMSAPVSQLFPRLSPYPNCRCIHLGTNQKIAVHGADVAQFDFAARLAFECVLHAPVGGFRNLHAAWQAAVFEPARGVHRAAQ